MTTEATCKSRQRHRWRKTDTPTKEKCADCNRKRTRTTPEGVPPRYKYE